MPVFGIRWRNIGTWARGSFYYSVRSVGRIWTNLKRFHKTFPPPHAAALVAYAGVIFFSHRTRVIQSAKSEFQFYSITERSKAFFDGDFRNFHPYNLVIRFPPAFPTEWILAVAAAGAADVNFSSF